MEEGWVYVLVNSSIPGMVKVGRTSRAPGERAAELSGVTGVATPFIVAYEQHFRNCHAAERAIHAALDRQGCRVAPNREFFSAAPSDIIRLLLEWRDATDDPAAHKPAAGGAARQAAMEAALLAAGDRALLGRGDALQDTGEAVRCYKLAMAHGSAAACERLGRIYVKLHAARPDRASLRRAMAPLKLGARRGNVFCYCAMSELFALGGQRQNFEKAWHLFFTNVAAGEGADASPGSIFAAACCRYIGLCLDQRIEPAHHARLRSASDAILATLMADIDRGQADAAHRARLVAALRWAYASLLPEPALVARRAGRPRLGRNWMEGAGAAAGLPAG